MWCDKFPDESFITQQMGIRDSGIILWSLPQKCHRDTPTNWGTRYLLHLYKILNLLNKFFKNQRNNYHVKDINTLEYKPRKGRHGNKLTCTSTRAKAGKREERNEEKKDLKIKKHLEKKVCNFHSTKQRNINIFIWDVEAIVGKNLISKEEWHSYRIFVGVKKRGDQEVYATQLSTTIQLLKRPKYLDLNRNNKDIMMK